MKSSKYHQPLNNPDNSKGLRSQIPKIFISRKNQGLSQSIKQRSRALKSLFIDYKNSNVFKDSSTILRMIQHLKSLKSLVSLSPNIRFLMASPFSLPIKSFKMIIQSLCHIKNLSELTFVVSSDPIFATGGLFSKEKIREINWLLPRVQIKLFIIPSPS